MPGQPRLDLLGLLPGVTAYDQVIGISSERRATVPHLPGMNTGPVTDACGLLQPVQCDIQQQGRNHAPNTIGNFCFEVTLGYRRLERGR